MFIFISLFSFSIAQFEIRWKSVWNVGDRIPVFFSTISLDTGRRAAAGQNQISTQQSTHRANGSLHWYDPAITALKPPQSCLFRCPLPLAAPTAGAPPPAAMSWPCAQGSIASVRGFCTLGKL
jgi:hypothetical protein